MVIGDQKKFLSVLLTLKTEVDQYTLEPQPELAPITLEWCSGIGSKAKVQGDPNQNFPFQMAITLKLSSSDPMLVKQKCV